MTTNTQPLKGGSCGSPEAHTSYATAYTAPHSTYKTTGFRTFRPARKPQHG